MNDYISRRAFIEAKEKQYCRNCDRRKNSKGQVVYSIGDAPCRACGIGDMMDDVEDFPAADVRPVVYGEWIGVDCSYWRHAAWGAYPVKRIRYKCSLCGRIENQKEPFCNCGAKMGGNT